MKKEKKNTKKLQKKNEIGASKTQDKNEFDNDLSIDNKPTNHLKNNPKSKTEGTKNEDITQTRTEVLSGASDKKFESKNENVANKNSQKVELSDSDELEDDQNSKQKDNSKSILAKIKAKPKRPVTSSRTDPQNEPSPLNDDKLIGSKRVYSELKVSDQEYAEKLAESSKDNPPDHNNQNEIKFEPNKVVKTKKTKLTINKKDGFESDDSGIEEGFDDEQIEDDKNDDKNNNAKTGFISNLFKDYLKKNDEINAGGDGSYAGRGKEEKKFFNKKYEKELKETGIDVNSNFFQMEHVVPVSTALKGTGIKRKSKEGYQIEKSLPAYLEIKEMHEAHAGTGNYLKKKSSGFNSKSYSNELHNSIEADQSLGNAYQLNQLSYAFTDKFQENSESLKSKIAFESFMRMTLKNKPVKINTKVGSQEIKLTEREQVEAILSRISALTGTIHTKDQEDQVKEIVRLHVNQ